MTYLVSTGLKSKSYQKDKRKTENARESITGDKLNLIFQCKLKRFIERFPTPTIELYYMELHILHRKT